MEISNKKRKAILRAYPDKSIKELSYELGISVRVVKKVLREEGRLAPPSFKAPILAGSAILALVLLAAGGHYLLNRPSLDNAENLNLVLVTVDTCRADRLGCYGYAPAKTPVMDGLAETGVRFKNAFAIQPITLGSHATIMSGTHSTYHGVEDNGIFKLPASVDTLAETLKKERMATAAIISASVLHRRFGLIQGFDYYDDRLAANSNKQAHLQEMSAGVVSDRAIEWLEKNKDRRFFLWLHYFDPHADYTPPPPYNSGFPHQYDGEIAYVDEQLGRVINYMDEKGLRKNTLVLVTSDHGEGLGEHREQTHGLFLYDATMHVPLIMSLPGKLPSGEEPEEVVSLMDVMPSVLEALGVNPPEQVQGRSLLPLLFDGGEGFKAQPVVMETMTPWHQYGWAPSRAIRNRDYKYIDAPRKELYDLEDDRGENNNLYQEKKGRAGAMAREMKELQESYSYNSPAAQSSREMDTQTKEELKSLGYLFTEEAGTEAPSNAPDVKDMVGIHKQMMEAITLSNGGEKEEAVRLLEKARQKSPESRRLLIRLANLYFEMQRYREAEEVLQEILKLYPSFTEAYLTMGAVYHSTDRPEKAKAMARSLLELDPRYPKAHNLMGVIHEKSGDLDTAEKHLKRAVELRPNYAEAQANLGVVYYHKGMYKKARHRFEIARKLKPRNRKYNMLAEKAGQKLQ